jgi:hypothetical protein
MEQCLQQLMELLLGKLADINVQAEGLQEKAAAQADISLKHVRFEVFTAVTMKNGVFWDVMPCGSCKNRRFGGT